MPHNTCNRHLTQELSKQYLSGTLTPHEMYLVEDRLLESDFFFEAMEGLEQMPWDRCQQAVDEASKAIHENFKIKKRSRFSQNQIIMAAVALIAMGLGTFWIIHSNSGNPMDLSTESNAPGETEVIEKRNSQEDEGEIQAIDSSSTSSSSSIDSTPPSQVENETNGQNSGPAQSTPSAKTAVGGPIAVGRIVDTRGDALEGILVSASGVKDYTDESGYYALRIAPGTTTIMLEHPDFNLQFEVDTSENWEIVVNVEQKEIIEQYPINTGNRFK
ncbi:MAG: hypothetical protein OER04_16815 [Cyclobacteriaceae bacterium]|nr:hypothetical protein [Cyclobacteriaceae bacterium]